MESVAESDALHERVRAFVRASMAGREAEPFDDLAAAIGRFQVTHVGVVARAARARGLDPSRIRAAADVPAIPCDAFRHARVAAHPAALDACVFRTSGTTRGAAARGEHALRTTATYELAALAWGERMLWPDGPALRAIVLAPPIAEAPDSSLGFMLDRFAARLGGPASWHVRASAEGVGVALDVAGIERACAAAREAGEPAIVLGTSFAFVHLLDALGGRSLALPTGSRAMQTGGYKGRSREVEPAELRARIAEAFAIPETHVIAEYGMTELSSQLYEPALASALGLPLAGAAPAARNVFAAPPWMRVTAVDPESLALVPHGEIGIARIVDLANVDSALAVQTSDRVRVTEAGVELLGRMPGANPRGCSIALDELLEDHERREARAP